MDQQQLEALIRQVVTEAVERTVREITERHEQETKGLRQNRDRLLAEKKALQAASPRQPDAFEDDAPEPVIIPKGATPQEYQDLKAQAEARGADYIVEFNGEEASAARPLSNVDYVETDTELYVNKTELTQLGLERLQALAEEKGKAMRLFRSAADLPEQAREKHDQIAGITDETHSQSEERT